MKSNRSLTEALETAQLPEAALAFVNAGAPVARVQLVGPTSDPKPESRVAAGNLTVPKTSMHLPSAEDAPPVLPPGPVSMTFRVPADLPEALLRASMARKLRRLKPWTQQDIVTTAIREWLERNPEGLGGEMLAGGKGGD
jgi:hypothetical protein